MQKALYQSGVPYHLILDFQAHMQLLRKGYFVYPHILADLLSLPDFTIRTIFDVLCLKGLFYRRKQYVCSNCGYLPETDFCNSNKRCEDKAVAVNVCSVCGQGLREILSYEFAG